jgi:uncharacterized membrane protein
MYTCITQVHILMMMNMFIIIISKFITIISMLEILLNVTTVTFSRGYLASVPADLGGQDLKLAFPLALKLELSLASFSAE